MIVSIRILLVVYTTGAFSFVSSPSVAASAPPNGINNRAFVPNTPTADGARPVSEIDGDARAPTGTEGGAPVDTVVAAQTTLAAADGQQVRHNLMS